ncbi:MAG: M23 family metallopeptidase [candidate division WOR-3 bacterium]|nr:MAG: M23 family metallopeptidase [candidate division WOR-3 bacterium]
MERLQIVVALKRRNRVLNLSIPVSLLYVAVFGAVGLLILAGFLGQLMIDSFTDYGRLNRLAEENARLKTQVSAYAAAVDTFRQFIARTEEMDNKLRAATDLCLIPADVRKMGVGGSAAPVVPNPELDVLIRRLRFEEKSMAELESAVNAQEKRLQRLPSIWPVQGWVTSGFGMRPDPFSRRRQMHNGMDIVAPYGSRIVASASGVVEFAGWKSGWGRCIEIDHGNGIVTFFAHCRSLKVRAGDFVKRGEVIATVGSSGRSTGTHLHYGVRRNGSWVNPRSHIIALIKRDPA